MKALPRVFLATFLAALLSGLVASVGGATGTPAQVVGLRIDGVINAYTADYITANISGAEQQGSAAVLITMDTPGGIDGPMRRIIQSILQTPLPVVIYVSPSGARAASAGLYISQAADVLAMAPGTNIGSAHPVSLSTSGGTGSSGSSVEDTKVLNDAAAYIRGLSALHGRNADWAEQAVRQSVN